MTEFFLNIFTFLEKLTIGNWAPGSDVTLLAIMQYHFPLAYNSMTSILNLNVGGVPVGQTLTDSIKVIGMYLMLIYFFVDLMSKVNSINFTLETFVRSLSKLIIGYALVTYAAPLCDGIIAFADAITQDISTFLDNSADYGFATNDIIKYLNSPDQKLTTGQEINLVTKAFVHFLTTYVLNLTAIVLAYSRAIKLSVYKIFMPMMVTDIFGTGVSGKTLGQFKKFLAAAMIYPLACVIATLTDVFLSGTSISSGNWLAYTGQLVMILYAVFRVMKSISDESEEIFGSR